MSAWEAQGATDEWYTPAYIFEALGEQFDLDVAAPQRDTFVPARQRFTVTDDGLRCNWRGFVWMNPPFGGRNALRPWLSKFLAHGNGIALTPDRTSAPWFQEAWPHADAVLFVRNKIKFYRPDGTQGKQPGTGTALWASGARAVEALTRAHRVGLGILSPSPEQSQ